MNVSLIGDLVTVASISAGGIYFYWRASDKRLTDISKRQDWFKNNYEGDKVHGDYIRGTIASVRCYPPQSAKEQIKRYLLLDKGRTEVTIMFKSVEIHNYIWDKLKDLIEDKKTTIIDYGYNPQTRSSFVRIETQTFDSKEVEKSMSNAVMLIDAFFREAVLN